MTSRSRWSKWALGLAALAMVCLGPGIAGAKDAPAALPEGSRLVKIGPQAVVLVDEHGNVQMYDDAAEEQRSCKSTLQCWGGALGAFLFFGAMTYEELTTSNEASSGTIQRIGPPD